MPIKRTLPPASAPLSVGDIIHGFAGLTWSRKAFDHVTTTICKVFSVDHAFFVSSGKTAITLTLQALTKIHPERTMLVIPSFNCYSVPSAIFRSGLTVLPCDIDPQTLDFDQNELGNILERYSVQILAVFATHFWGLPFDIAALRSRIKDPSIAIIEDAAQAMGSTSGSKPVGISGDVGIFSLSRGKALSAGEGGIIITSNKAIAAELKPVVDTLPGYTPVQIVKLVITNIILSICISPWIFWLPKMLPFLKLGETLFEPDFPLLKLSGFQAGLIKNWQKKLKWLSTERALRVTLYNEKLKSSNHITLLTNVWPNENLSCIRYPVIVKDKTLRDRLIMESEKQGLGLSAAYPDTINSIKEITIPEDLPHRNARYLVDHILTLPCHPLVTRRDVDRIVAMIGSVSC
ncbi:MAG: DegT/DnrJ/EryC1/StrS family aminotransferase [Chitinispirillaceae bacterium]|nr:DegT/DnrJ/EryC1/StrS family aminotransferase [Chitinispirillaceae bacterium]